MDILNELIKVLSKLQGIGNKSATRIAFDLLDKDEEEIKYMVDTITAAYNNIKPCTICANLTDKGECNICTNDRRDRSIICVVESSRDILAFDKSGDYRGLYHVLGGKIDPLNGVGVDELNIKELLNRLNDEVKEIIIALNPDLEGETTVLYLSRILNERGVVTSKIASGIPMGGNIEYSDMATLNQSIEGRQKI